MDQLARLPTEIRKEIFSLLLRKHKPIELLVTRRKQVARRGHMRDNYHRGQVWNGSLQDWVLAPPAMTAILLVNKQTYLEASQVLYGENTFSFASTTQITQFLTETHGSKQSVRHLIIEASGYIKSTRTAFWKAVALLPDLRSLQFSHLDFCAGTDEHIKARISQLTEPAGPILRALDDKSRAANLRLDAHNVLRIHLRSDCTECDLWRNWQYAAVNAITHSRRHYGAGKQRKGGCYCLCGDAERGHRRILEHLTGSIDTVLAVDV